MSSPSNVRQSTLDSASSVWEIEALGRLDRVASLCAVDGKDLTTCLDAILDAAVFLTGAGKGTLHLVDPLSGLLVLGAQRGFDQPFLDYFSYVPRGSGTACGAALAEGRRVIVEAVARSEALCGTAAADLLLNAGVRAVQSTPLMSSAGRVVGVLSTHFASTARLGKRELGFLDALTHRTADYLERHVGAA